MTTKEKKLLAKDAWSKDDLAYWMMHHLGEYILMRVEAKKKLSAPECVNLTKKAIMDSKKKKYERHKPPEPKWLIERQTAMYASIPKKNVILSDDDELDIIYDIEPLAQNLIDEITRLKKEVT